MLKVTWSLMGAMLVSYEVL
ncbi:unnamed protein product [Victoria cruziana]